MAAPTNPTTPVDAAEPPFDGLLLLRSGGMIRGKISRSADRWIVTNANRQIEIPVKSAELACRSLEEAYELLRKRIVRPTAEAHMTLADWCLRFDLHPQASRELLDARGLDPRHPRLRLLEERLAVANRRRLPPAIVTTAVATHVEPPVAKTQAVADPGEVSALPAQLSENAIERFTRKIQPVLVNNCTTSGCHQPGGAQQFQLDRALLHGMANRRSTMNNLTATLALVDRERPQLSPLLTVPRSAHGGMEHAVFGPHQDQLVAQLIDWVALLTAAPPAEDASKLAASDAAASGPVTPAIYEEPATLAPRSSVGPRYGAQLQPVWQPKDAFDPEIFNRLPPATGR
ncbi:MAG: hypothetical protein WD669_00110 [Pirellulales bacterium]